MRGEKAEDLVSRFPWRQAKITSRGQPSMLLSLLAPVVRLWDREHKAFRLFGWSRELEVEPGWIFPLSN